MQFGRDKLILMGLVALEEVLRETQKAPYRPTFALRAVLAMLFAMSDGDREPFNDFWHACQRKPDPRRTLNMEHICRGGETRTALNGIRRALGWDPTITLGQDVALAQREPLRHERYHDRHHGPPRSRRERQRRAFAEWLLARDGLGSDEDRIDSSGRWFNASDMCNLYASRRSAAEIARMFEAREIAASNAGEEVLPGQPGLVVRELGTERVLQSMTWGFPLAQKSKRTGEPIKPKPVNNIADLNSFMWRFIAPNPENRCLIPLTGFAEAEGEKGSKTRTWLSVVDQPVFAWAGMWKDSPEWGPVYSGLMTECNEAVRPVHNRMPVILLPDDYDRWLRGSLEDVRSFQDRCFPDELIAIERTMEPWIRRER